jgi:cytidine deaminase
MARKNEEIVEVEPEDQALIEAACEVLERNYHPVRHSVGAAVLGASGRIYAAINIKASWYGPCAEPIALGMALSQGERQIKAIVAVRKQNGEFSVLSPCGNCRQLLLGYAPEASVLFRNNGKTFKTSPRVLLPGAYESNLDQE